METEQFNAVVKLIANLSGQIEGLRQEMATVHEEITVFRKEVAEEFVKVREEAASEFEHVHESIQAFHEVTELESKRSQPVVSMV